MIIMILFQYYILPLSYLGWYTNIATNMVFFFIYKLNKKIDH